MVCSDEGEPRGMHTLGKHSKMISIPVLDFSSLFRLASSSESYPSSWGWGVGGKNHRYVSRGLARLSFIYNFEK